ncbi:flagellar filament capping protein FliD [Selenomonas caprae]|uniref:Flagellar hook-associated protein 2 n=1 Tax=Selenomonas caprae TaxID=2606905 RepID=A0A5D6WNM2_9FIRM|nr:flagellar filament capping protein FliD [Selenomonas caprae]TYZ29002.1 flagellar filament capping protein FliD [Selenomonas caprae]
MSVQGIYGLSGSGIDVDSMVKVGMLNKQSQYDKMYKKEVKNEWIKEAYTSLYSDLNTFKTSTMSTYKMSYTTNPMTAASTNSSVVSATANADAANMSHTVKVNSVSSNAYVQSESAITRNDESAGNSMYIKDIIAGQTEKSESEYKAAVDAAATEEEKAKIRNEVALSFEISNGDPKDKNTTTTTISFTYAELFDSKQTLNDLAAKIKNADVNMTATYDSTNDAFSIYQKDGGVDNQIVLAVKNRTTAETKDGVTTNAKADDAARALINNLNLAKVDGDSMTSLPELSEASNGVSSKSSTGSMTSVNTTAYEKNTSLNSIVADVDKKKIGEYGLSFTINDGTASKTIVYTAEQAASKSINDLMKDINGTGLNVTASLADGKLTLTNADSTKDITLSIDAMDTTKRAEASREFLNTMFNAGLAAGTTTNTLTVTGTNGSVTIDGRDYATTSSKINVANVTYNVGAVGSATVSISQDTDKLIENVKKFVEDYNKMIDSLNSKYNETRYSDYDVLTKSQENAMTQDQITKWNEKAKSGLLYHDQTLGKIISAMREAIYTPVDSVDSNYNTMMSIGIESSTDRGHLRLDEDKLKKALAADPDCVYQLFSASGDAVNAKGESYTDYNKEGVINRITDKVNENLKTMKSYAGTSSSASDGSTLGDLILEMQTKMSNFKTMMDAFEKSLYKKYDAMEQAIQKLSMQMGYISNGN